MGDGTGGPPRSAFGRVDEAAEPRAFVEFVDSANALESVRGCKRLLERLLGLAPGGRALDVGCGAGDDALALARRLGPGGLAVGVDNSAVMIGEARARAAGLGAAGRAGFAVGSALRLPVAPASFDACRAERLLLHLEDPPAALAEMRRALKPGGRLAVFDLDWEGLVIDHPDRALTRRLLQLICDRHRHPWLGRQLPRLLRDAGFGQVGAVPHTIIADYLFFQRICKDTLARAAGLGVADWGPLREWDSYLAAEARAGRFWAAFSGFAAYGRNEG